MQGSASDTDLRLAPAHQAILGGLSSPQDAWQGSNHATNNDDFADIDDVYAGLDLAACPPTRTAFPESQSSAYLAQQSQSGTCCMRPQRLDTFQQAEQHQA